jgi:PrcB C-terminal
MVRAGTLALMLLLFAAGCAAGDGSETPRDLRVERISSGAPGQGPEQPRVLLAPSASALSGAVGVNVPDSGEGTYLAVYWGEQPTGGYSLAVESARIEGDRVRIRIVLKKPPRGAILTQALTHPYAVAVVRDLDPRGKGFSFVDQDGKALGWPVRRVGG